MKATNFSLKTVKTLAAAPTKLSPILLWCSCTSKIEEMHPEELDRVFLIYLFKLEQRLPLELAQSEE